MSTQDQNPEHRMDAFLDINREHVPAGAFEVAGNRRANNRRGVERLEGAVLALVPELRAVEPAPAPRVETPSPSAVDMRQLDEEQTAMGEAARANIYALPNDTPTIEAAPADTPVAPPSEVATNVKYMSQIVDDRYNFPKAA